MYAVVKEIDAQGRVVIPAAWRKRFRSKKVLIRERGDVLELVPQEKVDLTTFFDRAEADIRADLTDWHAVRRDLRKR